MDDTLLETQRLRLRYQRQADVPFLVNLWSDPEATKYLGGPRDRAYLEAEFTKTATQPRAEEWDLWPVELKSTGELVGYAGLIPKTVGEAGGTELMELTYLIVPSRWGQSLASEIAAGLVSYAREQKGLDTLIAIIEPENRPSVRVAEKVGFSFWQTEIRGGRRKEIWRGTAPSPTPHGRTEP